MNCAVPRATIGLASTAIARDRDAVGARFQRERRLAGLARGFDDEPSKFCMSTLLRSASASAEPCPSGAFILTRHRARHRRPEIEPELGAHLVVERQLQVDRAVVGRGLGEIDFGRHAVEQPLPGRLQRRGIRRSKSSAPCSKRALPAYLSSCSARQRPDDLEFLVLAVWRSCPSAGSSSVDPAPGPSHWPGRERARQISGSRPGSATRRRRRRRR